MRRNRDPHLNERAHRIRALQSTLKVSGGGGGCAHRVPARIRVWAAGPGGVGFPPPLLDMDL